MKSSGINLTKYEQDLCDKNYKMQMKEIKDDLSSWRDIPQARTKNLNIIKMSVFPKFIYRLFCLLDSFNFFNSGVDNIVLYLFQGYNIVIQQFHILLSAQCVLLGAPGWLSQLKRPTLFFFLRKITLFINLWLLKRPLAGYTGLCRWIELSSIFGNWQYKTIAYIYTVLSV